MKQLSVGKKELPHLLKNFPRFCMMGSMTKVNVIDKEGLNKLEILVDELYKGHPSSFRASITPNYPAYNRFRDILLRTKDTQINCIGKLCTIFRVQDIADKNMLDILYTHISRAAPQMSHLDVYQTLRFMLEMGVCSIVPFVCTKKRLMHVYEKMDHYTLSYAIKAISFYDKNNVDVNIEALFARFMKIWPFRKGKAAEIVNISTAARECSYRDKKLAKRILNETLLLYSRDKIKTESIYIVHKALQAIGFHSLQLENAFLISSMRKKGIIMFG